MIAGANGQGQRDLRGTQRVVVRRASLSPSDLCKARAATRGPDLEGLPVTGAAADRPVVRGANRRQPRWPNPLASGPIVPRPRPCPPPLATRVAPDTGRAEPQQPSVTPALSTARPPRAPGPL